MRMEKFKEGHRGNNKQRIYTLVKSRANIFVMNVELLFFSKPRQ